MGPSCNGEWFTQRSSQTTALIISANHGCAPFSTSAMQLYKGLSTLCSEVAFGLFWISGFPTLGVTSATQLRAGSRTAGLCVKSVSTAHRKQSCPSFPLEPLV
jgi:hypothetical protein